MTTPTTTPSAQRVADDLAAIREQWGDLLAAIERPPATEWPPRDSRALGAEPEPASPDAWTEQHATGRMPLTLREHPAPLNLDALDAAVSVERALFASCDAITERVQRPVRKTRVRGPWETSARGGRWADDADDAADPARWRLPTHRDIGRASAASPGSRAHGLHWASIWLEGRALDEPHGDLFAPLPLGVLDDLATVARRALTKIERALGRDGRTTELADPCPWCGNTLRARTQPGGEPSVTCQTGEQCGAPVVLDRGRRVWRGADLVGLWVALDANRTAA
ncbi:hypothetical protein [Streptomyces sp. NPDC058254]|uniref:hypothetical protein n=1 Tax=Streptomyces sp. NPDC058254 TaxID=3346406 RepID=UPI0036E98AF7